MRLQSLTLLPSFQHHFNILEEGETCYHKHVFSRKGKLNPCRNWGHYVKPNFPDDEDHADPLESLTWCIQYRGTCVCPQKHTFISREGRKKPFALVPQGSPASDQFSGAHGPVATKGSSPHPCLPFLHLLALEKTSPEEDRPLCYRLKEQIAQSVCLLSLGQPPALVCTAWATLCLAKPPGFLRWTPPGFLRWTPPGRLCPVAHRPLWSQAWSRSNHTKPFDLRCAYLSDNTQQIS